MKQKRKREQIKEKKRKKEWKNDGRKKERKKERGEDNPLSRGTPTHVISDGCVRFRPPQKGRGSFFFFFYFLFLCDKFREVDDNYLSGNQ